MPRSAKRTDNPNPLPDPKSQGGKKICALCREPKGIMDFYYSASPMYSLDQRVPFCKECCRSYALNKDGSIDYHKFQDLLRKVDKPLYYDEIQRAVNNIRRDNPDLSDADMKKMGEEIIRRYFRNVVMRQHLEKGYVDSEKDGFVSPTKNKKERTEILQTYGKRFSTGKDEEVESVVGLKLDDFEVTPEVIELFGDGYSVAEYKKMYEKYQSLRQNYQIQTSLHQEALITYVRFKVKEEAATVDGKVDEAKKWYDAAQNAADKAKLSPKQLTKADLQKGLNSFSEISQAMEQAVDIIEILPRYKSQPQDSVDFNIWCYINYARKLKGLPTVEYSDVYHFYDEMKEEYLTQYGDPYEIFKDDATIGNRDNIEKFITLPADYEEIEYEDSGEDDK